MEQREIGWRRGITVTGAAAVLALVIACGVAAPEPLPTVAAPATIVTGDVASPDAIAPTVGAASDVPATTDLRYLQTPATLPPSVTPGLFDPPADATAGDDGASADGEPVDAGLPADPTADPPPLGQATADRPVFNDLVGTLERHIGGYVVAEVLEYESNRDLLLHQFLTGDPPCQLGDLVETDGVGEKADGYVVECRNPVSPEPPEAEAYRELYVLLVDEVADAYHALKLHYADVRPEHALSLVAQLQLDQLWGQTQQCRIKMGQPETVEAFLVTGGLTYGYRNLHTALARCHGLTEQHLLDYALEHDWGDGQ